MEISKDNYPYNRKFILTFLLCKILKEEEKMYKNTKGQEKGITLIALVITTIVHYVERLNAVISRVECI